MGQLIERREEICQLLQHEFHDKATRRHVANQIRIAMGLNPHDDDVVLYEHDKEAFDGDGKRTDRCRQSGSVYQLYR